MSNLQSVCTNYNPRLCRGQSWHCDDCRKSFCQTHSHRTEIGQNVECPRCERERLERLDERARETINEAADGHMDCDSSCDAYVACRAGLYYYAADFLVGAGADGGEIARALERLDPDGALRAAECETFAKFPYVACDSCGASHYGRLDGSERCCGKLLVQRDSQPDQSTTHRMAIAHCMTAPHGLCVRSHTCLEHAQDNRVSSCKKRGKGRVR